MNIVKKIDQYDENYVYFCEPIKNTIMNEGTFIRILYSTNTMVLNGIYLLIQLNDMTLEKYYNKIKYIFNIVTHKEIIEKIRKIEENVLKKANVFNKSPVFKIYEQLQNGCIKMFSDTIPKNNGTIILKISGIWENNNNYGLTFKFMKG
jgi:hypothetical protein